MANVIYEAHDLTADAELKNYFPHTWAATPLRFGEELIWNFLIIMQLLTETKLNP